MKKTPYADLPADIQDRYGYPRRNIGTIVMVVVGLGLAATSLIWVGLEITNQPVQSKLLTWSTIDTGHVNVTFEIRRASAEEVICVLRAQDHQHQDVGYATITIPSGTSYSQVNYSVATTAMGNAVELLGCSNDGAPKVAPPNFPPGAENPIQPWSPK